jgi:hypothetical protein
LLETEPRHTVQVYEWQYTRQSQLWCYQQSSPTLTFPIDAVPISGKFEAGYFLPDNTEATADVVPPPVINQPRMLRGYQRMTSLREIAESIWQGNAIVGTDGSTANDHGTCLFLCHTHQHCEWITNVISQVRR